MEMAEILWQSSEKLLKEAVQRIANMYESDEKYKILKIKENGELMGFVIYYDEEDGFRNLAESHYLGKNNYAFLKMAKFCLKDAKKLRVAVLKSSNRMIDFYKNINFKIVNEDLNKLLLERY